MSSDNAPERVCLSPEQWNNLIVTSALNRHIPGSVEYVRAIPEELVEAGWDALRPWAEHEGSYEQHQRISKALRDLLAWYEEGK